MPTDELFRAPFIAIGLDAAEGWLHVEWEGYQTVGTVQQGCERVLALLAQHGVAKVLNDNTEVLGGWSEAAEWLVDDWYPRMRAAGLRCFAWVYSPSRLSQLSADETMARLGEASGVQVFAYADEARRWLRSCA
ncbi:MAG TPA: STAS/SEC14 domain-containing protein [Longimicrobium sp.]|nr:STAS/SEC14 domain-containing protein [Longimicrobium sp.]